MVFWRVFFAVIGVGFATESLGLFAHELNLALAILGLALSAAMVRRGNPETDHFHGWTLALGAGLCCMGLFFLGGPWTSRFFAAALWFYGLHIGCRGGGADSAGLLPLGVGCLGAGIFHWLAGASLLSWHGLHAVCSGHPIPGPTFSGPALLVFAAVALLAFFLCSPDKRRAFRPCLLMGAGMILLYVFYLGLYAFVGFGEKVIPYLPALLSLFLGTPLGMAIWRCARLSCDDGNGDDSGYLTLHVGGAILASVLAALSVFSLTSVSDLKVPDRKNVAFYRKGFMNWQKPDKRRYGKYSAGMFGQLPQLIQCMGWDSAMLDAIDADALFGTDILVIINQNEALSEAALAAIEAFVRKGGSLLVLSDHTFWKEKKPMPEGTPLDARAFHDAMLVNQPIRFTDIRIRFDSADSFIGGWLHSYRAWPHSIGLGVGDHTNEPGVVVGASLDVRYPALPFLTGRYGYSDPGEREKTQRGFMGNLDYDAGEPLGDMVLAAAQRVGQGRVVVFGDTSSFVNAILSRTSPFVHRVFAWLGSKSEASVSILWEIIGLTAGSLTFLLVMLCLAVRPGVLLPLAATVCLLWFTGMARQIIQSAGTPLPLKGKVALVDYAHLGRFSLEGWDREAVDGLFLNLIREGYFTLAMKRFDRQQVMAADVFVSVAPSEPFSAKTVSDLSAFMMKGGTLILTAGWEDRAGIQPMLDHAGLQIPGRPLGRTFGTGAPLAEQPFFLEAWPVIGEGADTLATIHDEPVAVRIRMGAGQLVVIGDTQFFCNYNFEMENGGVFRNIHFFYWLLSKPGQQGGTPQAPGDR